VNEHSQNPPTADPAAAMVDDRNPWLGLASFTEETRGYFYGREDEVAELARRVQRKLLTVLFGQSGLGKTSILRAGLVPRLRSQGYCPVYVRIDYGKDSPEPAEQIKQAISRSARRAGEWTQAGTAVEGESLWEFLHHRDDVLRDESGATLIPLLIFDQFEEIFTLAQSDDFGRARAARFIEELADLVENRPPKSLEAKLDEDESGAERFDFARGDYRVLIALREDYLAPLEGLKKAMPSISQNRLRLARMNGTQALAAVMQPGKRLVTEEVAAAIVRFVAGGAELANAEVEPSLLSLICRELNDTRLAQGRDEISLDLLAGSHAGILSSFYERSLADQLPAVRRVIEDDLLTSSGFRENVAEERLLNRFKAVGAPAGTLAILVNRRLLRIEERLDVRRVELTHDVLCGVVKSSRDLRREREAREATEQLLAVIWKDVLGVERPGIHDNFFALGGDSIVSMQIASRAARAGVALTPRHVFQHQTIAELAEAAGSLAPAAAAIAEPRPPGPAPLVPAQAQFFLDVIVDRDHYNQSILLGVPSGFDPPRLEQALGAVVRHHVHDEHAPAFLERAIHRRERERRVGDVVEDERKNREVELGGLDRKRFERSLAHVDIRPRREPRARRTQHRRRLVHGDHALYKRRHLLSEVARATAEVADGPARIQ